MHARTHTPRTHRRYRRTPKHTPRHGPDALSDRRTARPVLARTHAGRANRALLPNMPERKGFSSDTIEEKRLECDPVPQLATVMKKPERVIKPHSSISQRIRQWESGNLKLVLDEIDGDSVEIICLEKESYNWRLILTTKNRVKTCKKMLLLENP